MLVSTESRFLKPRESKFGLLPRRIELPFEIEKEFAVPATVDFS